MTSPEIVAGAQPSAAPRRHLSLPIWLINAATGAILLGLVSGWVWSRLVKLPSFAIVADSSATVSERALTEFFAADAWFVICGMVVGLVLGTAVWLILKQMGWPVAFVAAGAGLLAGLACWQFGLYLGPGPLDSRLAAARPGDIVPIALELHSYSALAVWSFAAVIPVLLGSALGRDDEAPRAPRRRRRRRELPTPLEQVDDRGVMTAAVPVEGAPE